MNCHPGARENGQEATLYDAEECSVVVDVVVGMRQGIGSGSNEFGDGEQSSGGAGSSGGGVGSFDGSSDDTALEEGYAKEE